MVETRAKGLGVEIVVGDPSALDLEARDFAGVLVQYPATDGRITDFKVMVRPLQGMQKIHAMMGEMLQKMGKGRSD